jgi:hypothetical protein
MKSLVSANYRITMGTISLSFGIVSQVLSGFNWYNPDSSGIWALLTLGSTLIGIGLVKEFRGGHQ